MPTVNIFPDATINNDWTVVGTGHAHVVLLDNDYSNYLKSDTDTEYFEMTLGALDSVGLNIDTITSIQATMEANCSLRSQTAVLDCSYRDGLGAIINGYTQDITISTTGTNAKYDWTARTTSDGSTLWSDGDIDGMRLRIVITIGPAMGYIQISELYLVVTYTELPVLTTYPSAENIVLKNGTIILKNGLTIIQ